MIITYESYKGGVNNLIVVSEHLDPYKNGIVVTSTKSVEDAIRKFKKQLTKFNNI